MEEFSDSIVLKVIESYGKTDSIEKTAKVCGISTVKTRKILITNRLWSSDTSYQINYLLEHGKTEAELAKMFNVSKASINAYSCYDKGIYKGDLRSLDSKRAELYRKKIEEARNNQVFVRTGKIEKNKITYDNRPYVIKLELDFGKTSQLEKEILIKYGKSVDGRTFSREVLVPGDITFNALHYVIQKAFGWQNSHLRSFKLPEDVFIAVTSNKLETYYSLCGILFRNPEKNNEDYYWSDDFEECESFGTWLKRKYTGPYYYGGVGDFYDYQRQSVAKEKKYYKDYKKLTFGDGDIQMNEDGDRNDLLQSLPVASVLSNDNVSIETFRESIDMSGKFPKFKPLTKVVKYEYDFGDGWEIIITKPTGVSVNDRQYRQVMESYKPMCLSKNGIMLLDDVGGTGGYIRFLDCVFGGNSENEFENPKETLDWACSVHGWSKRNVSTINLL